MARVATGEDPLTSTERSRRMSKVKGRGNQSTEQVVARTLAELGIGGWVHHPKGVLGRPDFWFEDLSLALFVDGCFWHGCPICDRNVPRTRTEFWRSKIDSNRRRDRRVTRGLRRQGLHVTRVWEHQLRDRSWVPALRRMLTRLGYDWRTPRRDRRTEPTRS